ncbi:MAG: class B sortase [Oscillospiraceae bacterium]|nr:class B sortase [Oscillospiraceae bacterium]
MNKKYLIAAIVCLVLAAAVAAAALLGSGLFGSSEAEEPPLVSVSPSDDDEEEEEQKEEEEETYVSPIDFQALWERNTDIFGWLDIPGTGISYALLQSAEDDALYLDHDEDGNYSANGSLFTEATYNSTDMTDPVTAIYGHHMKSGAMFGNLQKIYSDADDFAQYSEVIIYLPEREIDYTVCAAVPFDNRHLLYSYDFESEYYFNLFWSDITSVRAISAQFNDNVEVSYGDHLIVLSTCLSGDNSKRYLVIARENTD